MECIRHTFHGAYAQRSVLMLHQLMNDNRASPVPGAVIFSEIFPGIKVPTVFTSGRVPAVYITVSSIRSRFCCIKSSSVKRIPLRAYPWALRRPAHPVIGTETIRIIGKHQIIPVTHFEKVRALIGCRIASGCVKGLSVLPVGEIVRYAQCHTAVPFCCRIFPGCQDHPPFLFLLIPEYMRISPVRHPVNFSVRSKFIFRDVLPVYKVFARRMSCPLGRRVLIEGTVEHMVNTVHFDHRPGSTLNVCRGFFVNPVVFRYDLMPAIDDLVFRCIRIPVFQIIVFESFRLLIVKRNYISGFRILRCIK